MSKERELLKRALDYAQEKGAANLAYDIEQYLISNDDEPVAWLWQSDNYSTTFSQRVFQNELEAQQLVIRHSGKLYPLYVSPPRKELRDEEIKQIVLNEFDPRDFDKMDFLEYSVLVARAVLNR